MNFTICVEQVDGKYSTERNKNSHSINGIIAPDSVYDLSISPGRNLRNWANIISASTYKQQGKTIKFAYGEGNYNVTSKSKTETITVNESADIPVNSLSDPLFIPEYYNFSAPVNRELLNIIRKTPYGILKFSDEGGNIKYGFLFEMVVEKKQKFSKN